MFLHSHPTLVDHKAAISEYMHSSECSRIDNTDKIPAIIDLGVDPETGARIYDLHPRCELLYNENEVLDLLTGRNRLDKSKPNKPHQTWASIVERTKTDSRKDGIKGSTKLIRQCKCPCMKKMKPSFCSCPVCERLKDALRRYNKYQVGWKKQADLKRRADLMKCKRMAGMADGDIHKWLEENEVLTFCDKCNGMCHEGKLYRKFSTSTSTCVNGLLCPKVSLSIKMSSHQIKLCTFYLL